MSLRGLSKQIVWVKRNFIIPEAKKMGTFWLERLTFSNQKYVGQRNNLYVRMCGEIKAKKCLITVGFDADFPS